MESSILFEKTGSIGKITLNRPDVFNSINREMALAFHAALDECKVEAIRAVCITGSGKAFCAGQDLAEITGDNALSVEHIVGEHYNPIIERMRALRKPVLCAVNGVAAGAGANIALAGDVVVASEAASFMQAFSKIGLVPDSGGSFFLPRLVGIQKASALMMLGDKVGAQEAERLGMIYKVFEVHEFNEKVSEMTEKLASLPTKGLALTKRLLNSSLTSSLTDQLALEEAMQRKAAATHDYAEGVRAFLEKRKPHFEGK